MNRDFPIKDIGINGGGVEKKDDFLKKNSKKGSKKKEKRKKRRKIEKNDAKRCTLGGVFSQSDIFLVLGTPDGVTREFLAGRSYWRELQVLK